MSSIKCLTSKILSKPAIFVAISVFIAAALIHYSYSRYDAFALKKGPIDCSTGLRYAPYSIVAKCCQTETDDEGIEIKWCTFCENTNPPSDCGPRFQDKENPPVPPKLPPPVVSTQPPSVAPPPKGSPPMITGAINQQPSSIDQSQFLSTPTGNNNTTTSNNDTSLTTKAAHGNTFNTQTPANNATTPGNTGGTEQQQGQQQLQLPHTQQHETTTGGGALMSCPEGTKFDSNLNQCVPIVNPPPDVTCPDGSHGRAVQSNNGQTIVECPKPPSQESQQGNNPKGKDLGQLGGSLLNGNSNPTSNEGPSTHNKGGSNPTKVPPSTDQQGGGVVQSPS
jgi:hypothetical protein